MAFVVARISAPKDPFVHPFQKWPLPVCASVFESLKTNIWIQTFVFNTGVLPFFDTDHSQKGTATRIGIQKKGGGWESDYGRASLYAKEGDIENNMNSVETCQWKVWVLGQLLLVMVRAGGGQKQRIWVRKKEWTNYDSFYFQIYAIYIETQNCLLLSICELVLVITLPIVLVFLRVLFRDSRSRSRRLNTYTLHWSQQP